MLTLTDIKLGLRDLLGKRRVDLQLSKAGRFHESELDGLLAAIEALPAVLTGGAPLAAELDRLDSDHDGFGAAIYFTTEIYLRLPSATPEETGAAGRIRAALIPALGQLGATYAIQADRAIERKPLLTSMKEDLQRFPIAGGGSLLEVATAYLDAGERLHHTLSDRADVPKASRKDAITLRPTAIGALNRLRADIGREMKKDPSLPQDLEQKVFGYIDTLERMHPVTPAAKPAPPAAEAPPSTKPER